MLLAHFLLCVQKESIITNNVNICVNRLHFIDIVAISVSDDFVFVVTTSLCQVDIVAIYSHLLCRATKMKLCLHLCHYAVLTWLFYV